MRVPFYIASPRMDMFCLFVCFFLRMFSAFPEMRCEDGKSRVGVSIKSSGLFVMTNFIYNG